MESLECLFRIMGELKKRGISIIYIYISHRLDEILQMSDTVTVLRDGQVIDTKPVSELDENKLINLMVGRELTRSRRSEEKIINREKVLFLYRSRLYIKSTFSNNNFCVSNAFGFFVLNNTRYGRYLYGIGANERASILSGVNVKKVKYTAYIVSGLLSSLASVVMLSRVNSALASLGVGLEFDVVKAVVLGGISVNGGEGKLQGVVIGLLIIAILSNGMILLGVGNYFQTVVKGLVLLIAVGIDNISKRY